MKLKRLSVIVAGGMIAGSILLGGGVAFALDKIDKGAGAKVKEKSLYGWNCPAGWHHTDNGSFPGACKPNKPTPTRCPKGGGDQWWSWQDNGCEVGCAAGPG